MANSTVRFSEQRLQDVIVTEQHIHQISSILGRLPTAMYRYPEFVGGLKVANRVSHGTPYQMFRDSLVTWKASNGMSAKFGLIFTELNDLKWIEAKDAILSIPLEGLQDLQIEGNLPPIRIYLCYVNAFLLDKQEQTVRTERVGTVVAVFLDDPALFFKWMQLADVLHIPKAQYIEEANMYRNGIVSIRELFKKILNCWVQSGTGPGSRTVDSLSNHLRGIECNMTADTLVDMLGSDTVIVEK